MILVITMLVLSSVFMFVMAHSLIQGHNSIAFEFSVKSKLSNLYAQSEDEQIENYGKAHCIVMDLAEAISEEDQMLQYEQTQVVFQQVNIYTSDLRNNLISLPTAYKSQTKLKIVK